jgi:dihydrofolate reductase
MTRISVFIASTIDNFIASTDGSLQWLFDAARDGEDYGYDAFLASVDALAMGRGTYDHIAHIDPMPFGGRPVYVFTHRPPEPRDGVVFWHRTPTEAVAHWDEAGHDRVYVDGGRVISDFLAAGLVDDLLLTKVPLLLGDGLPLFHRVPVTTSLRLLGVESFPSGLVNLSYAVSR